MIHTIADHERYLQSASEEVDPTDPDTAATVASLLAAVAGNGVGLAAIQLGIKQAVAVMQLDHYEDQGNVAYMTTVINPTVLLKPSAGFMYPVEGCLSVPGESYIVKRHAELFISYFDLAGNPHSATLTGFAAVVAQHEWDHLLGNLIHRVGKHVLPQQAR
jgi:peptide deformylase